MSGRLCLYEQGSTAEQHRILVNGKFVVVLMLVQTQMSLTTHGRTSHRTHGRIERQTNSQKFDNLLK